MQKREEGIGWEGDGVKTSFSYYKEILKGAGVCVSVCVVGCRLYTETTCFVIGRKKQNKTTTKMEHDGKRGGQAAEDLKNVIPLWV